jgi:hypothetical protein
MATLQDPDDIYEDEDTIGKDETDALLKEDKLPADQQADIAQTTYLTEKQGDDRGPIDELEEVPEGASDEAREESSGGIEGFDTENDQQNEPADSNDGNES